MRCRTPLRPLLAVVAGLTAASAAAPPGVAQPPRQPAANLIRLEGRLGPPGATDTGASELTLSHKGKQYRFQLSRLRVLTGSRLPSSILSEVELYRPNFFLHGAQTMVQRLDALTPGQRIEITGYYRRGSRGLLVSEITVVPLPTVAATGTASRPPGTPPSTPSPGQSLSTPPGGAPAGAPAHRATVASTSETP